MEVVLLLTGCIKPNVTDYIAVSDWHERQTMYVNAIKWYLENTDYKIVFAENSGTNIENLIGGGSAQRIEYLTFVSTPVIPDRSRSFKEMEIMEYAFSNSNFLKQDNILVVKITGRLILINIQGIVRALLKKAHKCNKGFVCSAKNARRPFSDCRYIYFTKNFFPILFAQKENIWPTYGMEWVLGDAIRNAKRQGIRFIYPPYVEQTKGIGMSHGTSLELKGMALLKAKVKHSILKTLFDCGVLPHDGKS